MECIVAYNGNGTINTRFEVYSGNNVVYSKPVKLSKNNNSEVINFTLPANNSWSTQLIKRLLFLLIMKKIQ